MRVCVRNSSFVSESIFTDNNRCLQFELIQQIDYYQAKIFRTLPSETVYVQIDRIIIISFHFHLKSILQINPPNYDTVPYINHDSLALYKIIT